MSAQKVRFDFNLNGDFGSLVKERVENYFANQNLSKKANAEMYAKTFFYLGGFLLIYGILVFGLVSPSMGLALALLLGAFVAGIGFNIGHDALHGAYSSHRWLNTLMGHSFSLIGASPYTWNIIHNIVHHSYTNIPGADGDLYSVKALKFFKGGPQAPYHRYQYIYAPGLYCLTSLVWVFSKDFVHIRRKNHYLFEKAPVPTREYAVLIISKALYYFFMIVVPLLIAPFAWWQILLGFLAMHVVAGFLLAMTFQLGHLVEGTLFPTLPEAGPMADTWSVHQLKSSANFSTRGWLASWLFGGLNFQIEHHLFPKICHTHYRHLSPIVQQTAADFGLPYLAFESLHAAVRSHLRYLKSVASS